MCGLSRTAYQSTKSREEERVRFFRRMAASAPDSSSSRVLVFSSPTTSMMLYLKLQRWQKIRSSSRWKMARISAIFRSMRCFTLPERARQNLSSLRRAKVSPLRKFLRTISTKFWM